MVNRIFDDYQGPSIKINGVCYKWAGETTEPFNSHPSEIEGTFDTCLECAIESSSSLSSESESSESINNFSSSSESIENTSSSESIACQEGDIQFVLSQANALQFSPPVFQGAIDEGIVCIDGIREGTYTNYGQEDLIVLSDPGAYVNYTAGQTVEVCEGQCPQVSSSSSSEAYSSESSSSSFPEGIFLKMEYDASTSLTTQLRFDNVIDYGDAIIYWGDGDTTDISGTGNGTENHVYDSSGTYEVKISATGNFWLGQSTTTSYRTGYKKITQWGDVKWSRCDFSFANLPDLEVTATDYPDLSNVTDVRYMLAGCTNMVGDQHDWAWDMTGVTDLSHMFQNSLAFNGTVQNFSNMGDAENLSFMFVGNGRSNPGSFNQPIGVWDTSSVTDITQMLQYQPDFDQDLSNWDVSNVTDTAQFMENFGVEELSNANYNALLISWGGQSLISHGDTISFGKSKYTDDSGDCPSCPITTGRSAIAAAWGTLRDGGSV